jgi:vacuolar-type H+-ATPase subunit D/Vma8
MERQHELESLRRSIAMLTVGAPALNRERAMRLIVELQEAEERLRRLRDGLVKLLTDDEPSR